MSPAMSVHHAGWTDQPSRAIEESLASSCRSRRCPTPPYGRRRGGTGLRVVDRLAAADGARSRAWPLRRRLVPQPHRVRTGIHTTASSLRHFHRPLPVSTLSPPHWERASEHPQRVRLPEIGTGGGATCTKSRPHRWLALQYSTRRPSNARKSTVFDVTSTNSLECAIAAIWPSKDGCVRPAAFSRARSRAYQSTCSQP